MKKWLKKNREILLFVFFSFLGWRAWLQFFLLLGWFVLPLGDKFLVGGIENFSRHPNLWPWANFDGEHYLAIAQHGYGVFDQAFFPLFPFLIKRLVIYPGNDLFSLFISGLTISHVTFFVALFILYFLVRLDFQKKTAQWTIIFLLVFPTSFFFASVYTESLFLSLILGSFLAARKGWWWLAGILGALASGTRLVGIFLLPALLWEWWEQRSASSVWRLASRKNQSSIISKACCFAINHQSLITLIPIFLVPIGLFYYMRYLAINFQDPLMFLHSQPAFGAQRVDDKLILLYQVFWRYFKMVATTKMAFLYFTVWLEFATTLVFLILFVFAYLKKVRLSYLIFAVLAFLTPTLTGTLISVPRFALVLFPCFVALALVENRILKALLLVVSCLLLATATIFFTRGYFVG